MPGKSIHKIEIPNTANDEKIAQTIHRDFDLYRWMKVSHLSAQHPNELHRGRTDVYTALFEESSTKNPLKKKEIKKEGKGKEKIEKNDEEEVEGDEKELEGEECTAELYLKADCQLRTRYRLCCFAGQLFFDLAMLIIFAVMKTIGHEWVSVVIWLVFSILYLLVFWWLRIEGFLWVETHFIVLISLANADVGRWAICGFWSVVDIF